MFTQCYKCETIFRLSAQALRTAGGQVRCGRCGEVFNALTRLAEDATAFNQGESPLDLEARADEILHTVEPVAPIETAAAGSGDIARLEVIEPLDDDAVPEGSLEFTLPPGELDRVFIETAPSLMQLLAAEGLKSARASAPPAGGIEAGAPAAAAQPAAAPVAEGPLAATPLAATPLAATPLAAAPPAAAPMAEVPAAATPGTISPRTPAPAVDAPGAPAGPAAHAGPTPMPSDPLSAAPPAVRTTGFEVSEDVRQEMLAGFAHAELPQINVPQRRLPALAWASAAVLLALALAGQLLLRNREWLSAYVPALADGASAATLAAYQLQQWGVTGEPGATGTLHVRATIMNTGAQRQPYPLLRVTLANRFGVRVAQREFKPSEYTGMTTARMLSPGERANATLDILDPGNDAEGFEIDLCLRASDARLRCATDAATRAR